MRTFIAIAVAAMAPLAVLSAANAATCQLVAAAGDGPTKDIATVMSTHGLENIIDNKGLKGQGPVKTKCVPGSVMVECTSQQKACK
jgi:hypothetical protein